MTTPSQLPTLDSGSSLWLEQIQKASLNQQTCTIPPKYFDVLSAWGFVKGTAQAAELSGSGLTHLVAAQQAAKSKKK